MACSILTTTLASLSVRTLPPKAVLWVMFTKAKKAKKWAGVFVRVMLVMSVVT